MWAIWRDMSGERRMWFVGKPGEWSGDKGRACRWPDKRDAVQIADWLVAEYAGHSGKLYTYGEALIQGKADPAQQVYRHGEKPMSLEG